MGSIPTLSKGQMYSSHLVNCGACHTRIKGNPNITNSYALRDLLCPVGKKLFDEAVREDPKQRFKLMTFPFIAKLHQIVLANSYGVWIKGKVMDFSLGAKGQVMGYEIEYEVPGKFKPLKQHIYVNRFNVRKAGD